MTLVEIDVVVIRRKVSAFIEPVDRDNLLKKKPSMATTQLLLLLLPFGMLFL